MLPSSRAILAALLLALLSLDPLAAPIDFSHVWFQHTNQIVYIFDQLSNQTDASLNPVLHQRDQCRDSMRQLVSDAKEGKFYANKSKSRFLLSIYLLCAK